MATNKHVVVVAAAAEQANKESAIAVTLALGGAIFTAAFAYTLQCNSQYTCLEDGSCRAFEDGGCSFSNTVSPAGYRVFNLTSSEGALQVLTRGVCSAGERQTLDSRGDAVCARAPAFPRAYNFEAADPLATTDHERACGRWLSSGGKTQSTTYFSFYDAEAVADDVTQELKAEFDPLIVKDDVDRFMAACERMLVANAAPPAAVHAYEHLKTKLGSLDSKTMVLHSVGRLASHYCDSPLMLGISIGSTDRRFHATATDGLLLGSEAASEALYSTDELSTTREMARAFIAEMATAPVSLAVPPTPVELNTILEGAIQGSWLDDAVEINGGGDFLQVLTDGSGLVAASKFLYALQETDREHARAYLLAVAAQCSFAIRSTVTGEFGSSAAVGGGGHHHRHRRRHRPASLGRLQFDEGAFERFSPVNSSTVLEASVVQWSQLAAVNGRRLPNRDVCWDATAKAFPDQLDEKVLQKLTSARLLTDVLPQLISNLKTATAISIQTGRMSSLVSDPLERAALATSARAVQFKIAGAPRGSQFGRDGEFERPDIRSNDGALLMLLKQARAVFVDRIALAINSQDLCQHPPLFPATSRNAYLLTVAPCAMLLPGILVSPFASNRYDEESLYGRIGFIISHEIAHVASRIDLWDETERERLLANYTRSTHAEAAADLTAAESVIATGKTTVEMLCSDVSQLWCAREPNAFFSDTGSERSHPPANKRGDNICRFLRS